MAWWSRTQGLAAEPKKSVPKGIWTKCERCSTTLYEADLDANFRVCTNCQHHFRMPTEGRIQMIVDDGQWQEEDPGPEGVAPATPTERAPPRSAGSGSRPGSSPSSSWVARWGRW